MQQRDHEPLPNALERDEARRVLDNVFTAASQKRNQVPLELMDSTQNYKVERMLPQKILLGLLMLTLLLYPLNYIAPEVDVMIYPEKNGNNLTTYEVRITTGLIPIPVDYVSANLDGSPLPITQTDRFIFHVEPTHNGILQIKATLKNNQWRTTEVDVTGLDETAPTMLSHESRESSICLYCSDDESGLDFEGIYAVDSQGNTLRPGKWNADTGEVIFDIAPGSLDVYVPDNGGNVLHLLITRHDTE